MSIHLSACAGDLTAIPDMLNDAGEPEPIPRSHKLALMAFAGSADDRTHIGFPGYEGVQTYAVCSRGRAAELIRDLVGWGLLKQHKRGHRGQRAEYVVFPGGCCDLHRKPVDEPTPDVAALAAAAGISVDQARAMLAAMGSDSPVVPDAADHGSPQEKGSEAPDAMSGNASGAPDPNGAVVPESAAQAVDNRGKGPERVHGSGVNADAFTSSKQNPLTPASGGTGCAKHPDPANPGANCRGCGTTNRQRAEKARLDRAAARRAAEQAASAAERAKPRGRKPGAEPLRATVRDEIRRGAASSPIASTTGAAR
jgi:hypothetical protein